MIALDTSSLPAVPAVALRIQSVCKRAHSSIVQACTSAEANALVLLTTSNKIKVYSLDNLTKKATIVLDDTFNRQMIVLGELLVCISKRGFNLFLARTGQKIASHEDAHRDNVTAICCDPNSKILVTRAADKSAFFWRLESVDWLSASPSSLDSVSRLGRPHIDIWDVCKLKSEKSSPLLPRALGEMIPIGPHLFASLESSVVLIDSKTLRPLHAEIQEHTDHVSGMVVFGDKYVLTSAWDGTLRFWEIVDSTVVCRGVHVAHSQKIRRMVPWGTRKFLTASKDRTVKVWEVEESAPFKLKCLKTFKDFGGSVLSLSIIEDEPSNAMSTSWAFAGDATGKIRLFNLNTLQSVVVRTLLFFLMPRRQQFSFRS